MRYKGLDLYPFQSESIAAIEAGKSVIVAAPTGAGKTLIAEYCIDHALDQGRRVVYTSPIKTLSNQKYRDFNDAHPGKVGIMTGDVTVNAGAPVLIMTTEIFRNTLFEDPARLKGIDFVIFDEVHFVDDRHRGTVWEESIIFAPPEIRFVGLSATIPNIGEFAEWMESVRGVGVETLFQFERPVPLTHRIWSPDVGLIDPEHVRKGRRKKPPPRKRRGGRGGRPPNVIDLLEADRLLPCLYFSFSRRECELKARDNLYRRLLTRDEQRKVLDQYDGLIEHFKLDGTEEAARFRQSVSRGIAYHHAGMLPSFKEIIETLFTSGRIKLLFTTETFALGVNMPARTVVFNSLYKFDGVSFAPMRCVDYQQMAGRAGRQGLDDAGLVITCIDPRRDRIEEALPVIYGEVEPVESKFNLGYSAILNLHERVGEDIFQAYDRSFKSFQTRGEAWGRDRRILQGRLDVLRRAAYIDGDTLTDKGRFASRIYGFEVQLAELFESGVFRDADEIDVLLILLAIVFEPRRNDPKGVRRIAKLGARKDLAEKTLERFFVIERRILKETSRGLEWGLSRPMVAWAKGCTIDDLANTSDVAVGDMIRYFRLTLQVIRQFRRALRGLDTQDLVRQLETADMLINRDEVDAESQLMLA